MPWPKPLLGLLKQPPLPPSALQMPWQRQWLPPVVTPSRHRLQWCLQASVAAKARPMYQHPQSAHLSDVPVHLMAQPFLYKVVMMRPVMMDRAHTRMGRTHTRMTQTMSFLKEVSKKVRAIVHPSAEPQCSPALQRSAF